MNHPTLSPDDPRLTAYALGELEGEARAAVEAALRADPALRAEVESIRATSAQLARALAAEEVPAVDNNGVGVRFDRAAIIPGHDPQVLDGGERRAAKNLLRFPQLYFVVSGLAAACFAVMFALRDDSRRETKSRAASQSIAAAAVSIGAGAGSVETGVVAAAASPTVEVAGTGAMPGTASEHVVASAFLESDLTLMDQAKHERETNVAANTAASAAMPTASGTLAPSTAMAPTMPLSATPPETPLLVARVPEPFRAVVAPTPAYPHTPSILPNFGPASPGSATLVATGEIVVLSAFTVTAERTGSFGASSLSTGSRIERANLPPPPPGARFGRNTEAYSHTPDNDFLGAEENPQSTFSIDVDTASYANVRRIIAQGTPPPADAVRIEEMLNYFPYRYAPPKNSDPFAATLEIATAPWAPTHRLVRIGLKAREVSTAERAPANLVFLLDVSGSMNEPNKLPLVKQSMRLLLGRLRADDRVAIVTYAGESGLALPSTPVARSREILNALDVLTPGGATNGAMGIKLAYEIARANFAAAGINRVILCTDGDFNVGATSEGELVRLIEEKAASGVYLTVLGFGMGNYKDATLEKLANHGNGNYGYIDTRREAEKLLVEQVSGTLVTVAKDVKIQVEFNPAKVSSYRLIGYENRLLKKEDFNNDKVDAGEIGAGHTVTALYEIIPVGAEPKRPDAPPALEPRRYGARTAVSSRLEMPTGVVTPPSDELLTVAVRFKKPDAGLLSLSRKLEFPLVDRGRAFAAASADFRFAAAVAQYGMILRGSTHRGSATMQDVAAWAATATNDGGDPGGYRAEFLDLVRRTQGMLK